MSFTAQDGFSRLEDVHEPARSDDDGLSDVRAPSSRHQHQQYKPQTSTTPGSSRPSSPPSTAHSHRTTTGYRRSGQTTGVASSSSASLSLSAHAPSLASPAFFRPMSSRRLQAQRSAHVASSSSSVVASSTRESAPRLSSSTYTRESLESHRTATPRQYDVDQQQQQQQRQQRQQQQHQQHQYHQQDTPPSPGTAYTEPDARDPVLRGGSPTENQTVQSATESTRPLQEGDLRYFGSSRPGSPGEGEGEGEDGGGDGDRDRARSPYESPRIYLGDQAQFRRLEEGDAEADEHRTATFDSSLDDGALQLPEKARPSPSSPPSKTQRSRRRSWGWSRTRRNHEFFLGNTAFCWGGRLQNTRDRPINVATGVLVVLPSVLFFVFEAPYLWYNISPAVPIVYGYLFFLCMSSFVHASVTNPGILPRNLQPLPPPGDTDDDPLAVPPPLTTWTMIRVFGRQSTAMDVPTKYCKTCNIWRPPRCHHCRICDNCIDTQDHHCLWLNNCIGRRNYRHFFGFVCFGSALGAFLTFASLGLCLHYAAVQGVAFGEAIDDWRMALAMFVYGVLVTPYPLCLAGYHLFLMSRGETTREYLNSHNFLERDRHRPFDRGGRVRNVLSVLLRARLPTYIRFQDAHQQGDTRFGQSRTSMTRTTRAARRGEEARAGTARTLEMSDFGNVQKEGGVSRARGGR